MDMTAEVTDRGICQDVQPEEVSLHDRIIAAIWVAFFHRCQRLSRSCGQGQSVAAACAEAAGECVALPVAGAGHGQDLCLTRQHDPSKCRENGGFDQDCCAAAGQVGLTMLQFTSNCVAIHP